MRILVAATGFACAAAVFAQSVSELPESLTSAQMREDLVYLRDIWAPMDRSFSVDEHRGFESIIDAAIENSETLTLAEFALEVSRAVAISGNGHTIASPYGFLSYLPIRVWWFSDGLYIVETHPDYQYLLGARIDRISDVTAEQALVQVSPFISGTAEHKRFLSTIFLVSLEALSYSGVTSSDAETTLTVQLPSGMSEMVTLREEPSRGPPPGGVGVLIPSRSDLSDRWPHVLDDSTERSPAFQAPTVDVAYEWMADESVLYIRSNRIISDDDVSLHLKLIGLLHATADQHPKFVILDLRLNTGGNFYNTIVFSQMLPAIVPDDGRIYVLVGNVTFSAAIVTAAMLKGNGGDKVSFVGERMGDSPRFWSEGVGIPLPNSNIRVAPASGLHDWSNGCAGEDDCFLATEIYATKGISLEPDVEVAMPFSGYSRGRDVVLETALLLAR